MKFSVKITIPLFIVIACAACLILFRSIPVVRIWNNYQVMYVEKGTEEKTVLSYLDDAGCKEVITLSKQEVPLVSTYAPAQYNSDSKAYLTKRLDYFRDGDNNFELFYIPEAYENQTARAVSALSAAGIKAGLDGRSSYPWLVPVICLVLFIAFAIASKNKLLFAVTAAMPLLFTVSKPFYPNAAGVILFMLALFLAERYWQRKGALQLLYSNVYTVTLTVFSLVAVFSSWQAGMLFLLVICASVASLLLYAQFEDRKNKESSFSYTLIIPARMIPVMQPRTAKYTLLSSCSILVLLVLFFTSARFVPQISVNGLSLPSPSNGGGEKLPALNDYFVWAWNTVTYPYKNFHADTESDEVKPGDKVTFIQYRQTENGIEPYEETPYVFNSDFMNTAEKNIDSLKYPAIEKLMKKQGRSVSVSYVKKSSGNGKDGKSLVFILISMGIPLLLYLYYTISGRRKYENRN